MDKGSRTSILYTTQKSHASEFLVWGQGRGKMGSSIAPIYLSVWADCCPYKTPPAIILCWHVPERSAPWNFALQTLAATSIVQTQHGSKSMLLVTTPPHGQWLKRACMLMRMRTKHTALSLKLKNSSGASLLDIRSDIGARASCGTNTSTERGHLECQEPSRSETTTRDCAERRRNNHL